MSKFFKWFGLQIFADGGGTGSAGTGDGGGEGAAAPAGETAPDAGETRLRELGVPESVLAKRAKRAGRNPAPQQAAPQQPQQVAAAAEPTPEGNAEPNPEKPARMSWDEIMADPEYNKQMQSTIQSRLKSAKNAEDTLSKLAPAFELLSRRYGLDAKALDADALAKAISDDDTYYEDKALEMGVDVDTAKKIDKMERDEARRKAEEEKTIQQRMFDDHFRKLQQQGEAMKATVPNFDLATELANPAFARMTSPNVNIPVEDAYYAVHRKEIQTAAMQATAQRTAKQIAASIRSGQSRPVENGISAQAPSNTTFDYAHASKEQREALKKQIREAAAHGKKLYPGQFK